MNRSVLTQVAFLCVLITPFSHLSAETMDIRITTTADDAEESDSGVINLDSSDLELVRNGQNQEVGLRFAQVDIPPGSNITQAYIQFQADEIDSGNTDLQIRVQDADNAPLFSKVHGDISSRPLIEAAVDWNVPAWHQTGQAGPDQKTPDLRDLVQTLVNRAGWSSGNAMVFVIDGNGVRVAESHDGEADGAALLHVEYEFGAPVNTAPIVDAGRDQTITSDVATVELLGTVQDDGLPQSTGAVTLRWNQTAGPSTAVNRFGADSLASLWKLIDPGVYEFQLEANDGELTGSDTIIITVLNDQIDNPPTLAIDDSTTLKFEAGQQVTLNATAADAEDDDVFLSSTIVWESSTNTHLGTGGTVTFIPDTVGELEITASVTDNGGNTVRNTVTITVQPGPANPPPVVSILGDETLTLAENEIELTATISDGDLLSPPYVSLRWVVDSVGGNVVFDTPTLSTTRVAFNAPGVYLISLIANNGQAEGQDSVRIIVQSENLDSAQLQELALVPIDKRHFVDANQGADSGYGDIENPWKTLDFALTRLPTGHTLYLRSGRYDESTIEASQQGDANNWTSIRNFPGEVAVIDASLVDFRQGDASAWESVDGSIGLYRSTQANYEPGEKYVGWYEKDAVVVPLIPYWEKGSIAHGLDDLSSREYEVSSGARYVGPGIFNDDGHLYVRLQHLPPSVLRGSPVVQPPLQENPNLSNLHLSEQSAVFRVTGSYVIVKGLNLQGAKSGVEVREGAHHVKVIDSTFRIMGSAVLLRDEVNAVVVSNNVVRGDFPAWVAWTDMKGSDGQSQPASYSSMKISGVNGKFVTNVTVSNNTFENVFDGMVLQGANLVISGNRGRYIDDMVQLGSNSYNVEISNNIVHGAGPSHYGKGDSADPGTIWIHHNIIDSRVKSLWSKPDPKGLLREHYRGWQAPRTFPDHSTSGLDHGDPWKVYYNTVLFDGAVNDAGLGLELWDQVNDTGVAHEVYNNIFVETAGGVFFRDLTVKENQVLDGNVYWRASGPSTSHLFSNLDGRSSNTDYGSLAVFRDSADYQSSTAWYPPGWETAGSEEDPQLNLSNGIDNFFPTPEGSAGRGAVLLPESFPGPRHDFRGALNPLVRPQ